jgi:cytochrome oxidase Cu insertion factor (SCO1/SenC/PrrC family)
VTDPRSEGAANTPSVGTQTGSTRPPLSTADRAAALASGRAPLDRAAALRAGSAPVPRKVITWIIVGFAALGLGGIVAERFFGNAGVGTPTTSPTTLAGTSNTAPPTPAPPAAPPIGATLDSFIGLKQMGDGKAPAFDLRNQNGVLWSPAHARGKVVVLTFFNSDCSDICPVLGQEINQANDLLRARGDQVDFVVVNTDPLQTSLSADPPALSQTALSNLANVTFLNGTLSQLDGVWSNYAITVTVQKDTRAVNHNDLMYFIDPQGSLRLRATPFANEDQLGAYGLGAADIQRFAQGIAVSAASLSPRPR